MMGGTLIRSGCTTIITVLNKKNRKKTELREMGK